MENILNDQQKSGRQLDKIFCTLFVFACGVVRQLSQLLDRPPYDLCL